MSLLSELKRRNVLRVAAAYIVTAWLLIQVAETIFPLFGYGTTPARFVVMLLVIGFVPTLVISWMFEITSSGLQKDDSQDRKSRIATRPGTNLDRSITVLLILAVTYFSFDKFIISESQEQDSAAITKDDVIRVALETLKNNKSIAVLPFADMSPNQDQRYFADGITEELLDDLGQFEGLNIVGRTSAFAFQGQNQDIVSIGEQLGVAYILDGSVRKNSDTVRIAAQLNSAVDGTQLWSETYDRPLQEIFFVQEDISRSVAGALSVALSVSGDSKLPGAGTTDVQAYDAFLEANEYLKTGNFDAANTMYQRAIDIDPNYAEAWAARGASIGMSSYNLPSEAARAAQEQGRDLVVRASVIDPGLAAAHAMLSSFQWARGDWVGATELFEKYRVLVPTNMAAQFGPGAIFARTGRLQDAMRGFELNELQNPDPLNFVNKTMEIERFIQSGRYSDAVISLDKADLLVPQPEQATAIRRLFLAVSQGETDAIRDALQQYVVADSRTAPIIEPILANFDSETSALAAMRDVFVSDTGLSGEGRVIMASMAAFYGDPQFALDVMSEELSTNVLRINRIWYPYFSEMRGLPGFKNLAEDTGLLSYWRTVEWADSCRPVGDNDFECN